MTKLLEQAVAVARRLPPDEQDEIGRLVLSLAADEEPVPVPLSPDERAAIANSKAAAVRGEFASDEGVRATWAKAQDVKLRYTTPALADLDTILDYIATQSP